MANKSKTKCLSCGEIFTADVRNRGRQKYCAKPGCRAAGKAARQRRWREQPQNQDYFRDVANPSSMPNNRPTSPPPTEGDAQENKTVEIRCPKKTD